MMTKRSFLFAFVLLFSFVLVTPSVFAATTPTFKSLLGLGSSGTEVTALQKALAAQGLFTASATGYFGPATQASLKKFQTAHGIASVGYTGPATRAALNRLKATASAGTTATATGKGTPVSTGTSVSAQLAALQAMVTALQAQLAAQNGGTSATGTVAVTTNVSAKPTPAGGKSFETSGWIPYWRMATGVADVTPHLSQMTEVDPFGFSVKTDGTVADTLDVSNPTWQTFFQQAHAKNVRVIATVMWSDTASIHTVLSNPTLRAAHIQSIVNTINKYGFDGVDIDYEGKLASDKDNFSAFLQELNVALAAQPTNKWLMCTIEARTPPSSLNTTVAVSDIQYANDYAVINKYCDRVRLMTYDQESADAQLNAANKGQIYTPIADPAWIKKVVALTEQTIDKSKIELGVATYGYIYQLMPATDGSDYGYTLLEAFNPAYATQIAAQYHISPTRNSAGELSFTYVPTETNAALPSNSVLSALAPKGTSSGNLAAAGALALAQNNGKQSPVQLLWWSDAQAIQDKINLAKQLGLRGVSIFKLDGGEDQGMWNSLQQVQ